MKFHKYPTSPGFTLVELLVTLSIVAILSSIIFAGFDEARKQARDKVRMTSLKELQLAIEQYRAQKGTYPLAACGPGPGEFSGPGPASEGGLNSTACPVYVAGLIPDYISALPTDPNQEYEENKGFYYRSDGSSYKLMIRESVETIIIGSETDDFARCPSEAGACTDGVPANTYAVYSLGAEDW